MEEAHRPNLMQRYNEETTTRLFASMENKIGIPSLLAHNSIISINFRTFEVEAIARGRSGRQKYKTNELNKL